MSKGTVFSYTADQLKSRKAVTGVIVQPHNLIWYSITAKRNQVIYVLLIDVDANSSY
jgi:hypothetical protein